MCDSRGPLVALADKLPWEKYEASFEKYYSHKGHPNKPIRLIVGVLLLTQLKDLLDEEVVLQ